MTERVELHVPPDDANVGLARLVVVAAARHVGMDPERLEDVRLVVSEAATNAVISHQRMQTAEPITVAIELCEDGLFEVVVTDQGPGFEPPSVEGAAPRDWSREGGLGLTLMRSLADDAAFERVDGMQVRLRFSLDAPVA